MAFLMCENDGSEGAPGVGICGDRSRRLFVAFGKEFGVLPRALGKVFQPPEPEPEECARVAAPQVFELPGGCGGQHYRPPCGGVGIAHGGACGVQPCGAPVELGRVEGVDSGERLPHYDSLARTEPVDDVFYEIVIYARGVLR